LNNTINGGSGSTYSVGVEAGGAITLMKNHIEGGAGGSSTFGVLYGSGRAILTNNIINGGSGSQESYGVFIHPGTATLINNLIDGGSGSGRCYGVETGDGLVLLAHNTLVGGAGENSAGIIIYRLATLINNTIDGGSGSEESIGVITLGGTEAVTLMNNTIWGYWQDFLIYDNHDYVTLLSDLNACEWHGCTAASGNINDDPLFVDPTNGDYHLQSTSPCRDTGINPVPDYIEPGFVDFDFDGEVRPYGPGWDIGADEWMPLTTGKNVLPLTTSRFLELKAVNTTITLESPTRKP
jgi:hypothetical protein